jgi:hypothetical protein
MSHVFFDSGQFTQIGRNTRHLMCSFLYLALTLPTAKGRGILASWQIASPPLARRSVLRLLHERSGCLHIPGFRRPCGTVSLLQEPRPLPRDVQSRGQRAVVVRPAHRTGLA